MSGGDAQENEDLLDLENGVGIAGDEENLVGLLLGTLATDAVVGEGLSPLGRESVGEGKGEEGERDVGADGLLGLLGIVLEAPPLLEFAKRGVLDQAAQVVEIQDCEGERDWQAGEEDFLLAASKHLALPAEDDQGTQGIAHEIFPIGPVGVRGLAVLVETTEVGYSDYCDLSLTPLLPVFPAFGHAGPLVPDDPLPVGFLTSQSLGVRGDAHGGLAGHHEVDAEGVFEDPEIRPVEEAAINQENPQDPLCLSTRCGPL